MNYPAIRISVSRLARLGDAQRQALDDVAMGKPVATAAPRIIKPKPHIEIDKIGRSG